MARAAIAMRMDYAPLEYCFDPIVDAYTRLLLLGSLPGARSLAERRYYAHPRNQFWRLVGAVIERDLPGMAYWERLDALRAAGIGLWDMVAAARRRGSLDSEIRLEQASDVAALAESLPQLRAIGFNGGTAARLGRRQFDGHERSDRIALIDLPSSSPAFTLPFAAKLERWLALRAYL